ncbi:hypothetical protein TNCV_1803841 [Trichonephila clavipes]|nr:hypothetical protein TNCV_1803841 [Trichonephila clavipes]
MCTDRPRALRGRMTKDQVLSGEWLWETGGLKGRAREFEKKTTFEIIFKRRLSKRYLGVCELTKTKADLEPRSFSSQQQHGGDRASELTHYVWNYRKAKTFSSELWAFFTSNPRKYHFDKHVYASGIKTLLQKRLYIRRSFLQLDCTKIFF